jgi:hypothetical protein
MSVVDHFKQLPEMWQYGIGVSKALAKILFRHRAKEAEVPTP